MKHSTDLSKKPFGINSCFSKGKRGGGETPPGHLRPRGADTRFSRRPCPACRPGETHGVRVRSPGGSEEARDRNGPTHSPAALPAAPASPARSGAAAPQPSAPPQPPLRRRPPPSFTAPGTAADAPPATSGAGCLATAGGAVPVRLRLQRPSSHSARPFPAPAHLSGPARFLKGSWLRVSFPRRAART